MSGIPTGLTTQLASCKLGVEGAMKNPRNRVGQPIYSRHNWVLGQCLMCGRLNYVEPHGTTAACVCVPDEWQEHRNIPYQYRTDDGTRLRKPVPREARG